MQTQIKPRDDSFDRLCLETPRKPVTQTFDYIFKYIRLSLKTRVSKSFCALIQFE